MAATRPKQTKAVARTIIFLVLGDSERLDGKAFILLVGEEVPEGEELMADVADHMSLVQSHK